MKERWQYIVLGVCALLLVLAGFYMSWYRAQNGTEDMADGQTETADGAYITLSGADCSITGSGAVAVGDRVMISRPGTYEFSGTRDDGQIYVNAGDEAPVVLVFDGLEMINKTEPAVYIEQAKETRILLADGSENLLQSGSADEETTQGTAEEEETGDLLDVAEDAVSGGALYSRDDLTVTGDGSLTVCGYVHDGIHGNDSLTIAGGTITVTAAKKGVHANDCLVVGDGELKILDSFEGLEADQIYIDGGDISISSRDDGINAFSDLTVQDGTIYVNARGDGLDSNGDLTVNGGALVVDGPDDDRNGALDYGWENDGTCRVNGGIVLAVGASGMAESFDTSSGQASVCLDLNMAEAGSRICILDAEGNELFSHTAAKCFSNLVFSCPELSEGGVYQILVEDQSTQVTLTSKTTYESARQ